MINKYVLIHINLKLIRNPEIVLLFNNEDKYPAVIINRSLKLNQYINNLKQKFKNFIIIITYS